MKIYTKTGDLGETGIWGGQRLAKSHARLHAYGTVDECNAILGLVVSQPCPEALKKYIHNLQNQLFVLGSDLASPLSTAGIPRIAAPEIRGLENWIDELELKLPPLQQFILPGGSYTAALLHQARTVCRRAERWTVELLQSESEINPLALVYLNRLSDLLFVMARFANLLAEIADIPWEKPLPASEA